VDVFRSFHHAEGTVPLGSYLIKKIRSAVLCDCRRFQVKRSGISWWLLDEDNIKITDSSFYLPILQSQFSGQIRFTPAAKARPRH